MERNTPNKWLEGHQGERLGTEVQERLLTITLDNPPVNALDRVFYQELQEVFSALASTDTFSAVLLIADNRCFCAGQDRRDAPNPPADPEAYLRKAASAIVAATECPIPVVAGVKSAAIGAGFILALTADVLVIDADATLALPERKFGVIAGYAHLSQWVGKAAALAVITGEHLDPQVLAGGGAVVVPTNQVDAEAKKLAQLIAESSPTLMASTKSGWAVDRQLVSASYQREIELTLEQDAMDFSLPRSTD